MGTPTRLVARPLAAFAALTLLASAALAAEPGVKDDAGMFSNSAVQQADGELQKLKQQYNHTVNVETYASTPAELQGKVDGNESSKEAAYRSFTENRARALGTDVYVFISKSPGHVQVTARSDLSRSGLTPQGRDRMRADLVNYFKQKDFDGGLANMTRSLAATYAGTPNQPANAQSPASPSSESRSAPPPANPWPGSSNAPAETKKSGGLLGSIGCFGLVIILVVLFIVIRLIGRLFGNRNRNNYPPQGGYGPGQAPPPGGYGANYGGGYPPNQGGGGFGRGVGGGILGGLLGSWIGGNVFGGQSHHDSSSNAGGGVFGGGSNDTGNTGGDTSGFGSSGGDFGGSSDNSSSGFDSGGGSDFGSSGSDFGSSGGDSGGGGGSGDF